VPHYVYGIVKANAKPPTECGIAQAPLRIIAGEAAAALVSDLPGGEVRLGREEMLAHARNADRMRFKYTGPLPPHSVVQLAGRG
jgi:hypothetical protein